MYQKWVQNGAKADSGGMPTENPRRCPGLLIDNKKAATGGQTGDTKNTPVIQEALRTFKNTPWNEHLKKQTTRCGQDAS